MSKRKLVSFLLLLCSTLPLARCHSQDAPSCAADRPLPVLRIVLIRHAESFNNVLNLVSHAHYTEYRVADPPLTHLGEEQAIAVAKFLAEARSGLLQHVSELFISPTIRTLHTAQPIAARLPGVRAVVDVDTFEVGGVYDHDLRTGVVEARPGLSRAAMSEFGYELPAAAADGGWYAHEGLEGSLASRGKETKAEGRARASRFAERMRSLASSLVERKTIALVSHGDFIGLVLADLLSHGHGAAAQIAYKSYNTGISCLELRADGSVVVLFLNSVAHLQSSQYRANHLGVV